ncbi:hypothetical protein ACI5KX_13050 [Erythrobacter sp. GH1-10]|uniref:hypothetical protein n=1 Tax=Erythrobacter sp. GH1-10 TaxID=3349334 RepID=UPI0038782514
MTKGVAALVGAPLLALAYSRDEVIDVQAELARKQAEEERLAREAAVEAEAKARAEAEAAAIAAAEGEAEGAA